jgi:hypothetical protein
MLNFGGPIRGLANKGAVELKAPLIESRSASGEIGRVAVGRGYRRNLSCQFSMTVKGGGGTEPVVLMMNRWQSVGAVIAPASGWGLSENQILACDPQHLFRRCARQAVLAGRRR